ncbi:hypothetical protein FQR65_LT13969 [Abscondita terminalis]|nr:hypothetical protein FQR65_LT13969 [Abscondita terminalis]
METVVIKICLISLLDLLAVGITFPLLYPHLKSLGASHTVLGIFGATYSGLQVISGPIIGSWSDLRGRKFVASIVLIASAISYICTGLTSSLFLIYFLRIILGFTKHTQTLCKAIIADTVRKDEQTKVHGWSTAISSLGFVFGPIIGGHLIEIQNGFSYVCTLTAILFIINFGLICTFPDNKPKLFKSEDEFRLLNFKTELKRSLVELTKIDWKIYWDVFTLRFLFSFAISIYFSNQALYIQEEYGLSQKYIGYIISFFSVIGGMSSLATGYIKTVYYKNDPDNLNLLFQLFLMMTLSFVGIYFSPNLALLLLLLMPFAFSSSLLRIVSMEVILNRSHSNDRGSLAGVSNSVMSVGRFVSPVMSGVVADGFGEDKVMLFAFLPSLMATFLCFRLLYRPKIVID